MPLSLDLWGLLSLEIKKEFTLSLIVVLKSMGGKEAHMMFFGLIPPTLKV